MKKASQRKDAPHRQEGSPHRVRLPGFVSDEEIGLGDVIKRATSYIGIQPCGGCARRAAALNRWMVFTGRAR
jgi:hypothetical protein